MFREGIGVVVEGALQADGTFATDRLMIKHDNEYQAPGKSDSRSVKELAETLEPESPTMISILGRAVVLAALLLATSGAVMSFAAAQRRSAAGVARARLFAYLYAVMMTLATGLMIYALVAHDFSVSYVAQVGSLATPLHITIVSLWSSLDGSILFWGLVLGAFTAGSAFHLRKSAPDQLGYMLGTLFVVGIFFTFLIAGPADPFAPTPPPVPTDGPGPNPLLQNHPLMIIHPPMLYLGYVGMSVPFAIAMAALFAGRLDRDWIRSLRSWLLVPTGFLTMGVMLGGWWSYEVLGWGGYWAWDPVENASFLPWLTAIAAVHSALVLQRKGTLRAWTVVLVVVTFLLTILGTFLTRSGVVNSVHSFTQTPIGPAFLAFLGFCLVASVVVLAMRMDTLASDPDRETLWTREGAFLINNLLLLVFMFTVLVGTLFPIAAELVRGVKVSVGEPYFNRMAIPISLGLLLLIGIGPALPWGRADNRNVRRALLFPIPAAIAGPAADVRRRRPQLGGPRDRRSRRLRRLGQFRPGTAPDPQAPRRRAVDRGGRRSRPAGSAPLRRLPRPPRRRRDLRRDRRLVLLPGRRRGDDAPRGVDDGRGLQADLREGRARARSRIGSRIAP